MVKEVTSPFYYCDVVTSTIHKSLPGLRGGIIFYRRGTKPRKQGVVLNHGVDGGYDFEERINFALSPSSQGGPCNNHIAVLAIASKQVKIPEHKACMHLVKKNAKALPSGLLKRKGRLVTDGSDNRLLLWDLTAHGLFGQLRLQALYRLQREHGKSCKDFLTGFQNNKDNIELRNRVETFAFQFAMPGFNISICKVGCLRTSITPTSR